MLRRRLEETVETRRFTTRWRGLDSLGGFLAMLFGDGRDRERLAVNPANRGKRGFADAGPPQGPERFTLAVMW